MRTSQAVYWFTCFLVFAGALTLVGCDRASVKWSEEVRLADGRMIVVARTAQGRTYSELGGTGGWRDPVEMSIALTKAPGDIKLPPEWRDTYVPVLLDYDESDKSWSIVTTFYYCETWHALGRPILPYIECRSVNGAPWQRVPLEERLIDRKANMLTGPSTDGEPSFVTVEEKERLQLRAGSKFQRILRRWGSEEGSGCSFSTAQQHLRRFPSVSVGIAQDSLR